MTSRIKWRTEEQVKVFQDIKMKLTRDDNARIFVGS